MLTMEVASFVHSSMRQRRSTELFTQASLVISILKVYLISSTAWVDPRGKSWLIIAKVVSSLEQDHVTPTHWSEPFANRLAFFFPYLLFFFPILNFDVRFYSISIDYSSSHHVSYLSCATLFL